MARLLAQRGDRCAGDVPAPSNAANPDLPIGLVTDWAMEMWYHPPHCMNDPQPEGRMASYIRRRKFLATLGGAAAWPLVARAQYQTKIPRIGIIDDSPRWKAFRHELRDLGYLEGQNIAFDYAYADGVPERLAEAAAALVRRPVDVIATLDRKSTRLNSSHLGISYAVFCLKKK